MFFLAKNSKVTREKIVIEAKIASDVISFIIFLN